MVLSNSSSACASPETSKRLRRTGSIRSRCGKAAPYREHQTGAVPPLLWLRLFRVVAIAFAPSHSHSRVLTAEALLT
jgi:hypothetical protein